MKNGKIHLGPIVDSYDHVVGVKLAMQTMNRDGDCGEEIAYFDNPNIAKACIKSCAEKVRIIRWDINKSDGFSSYSIPVQVGHVSPQFKIPFSEIIK